MGSPRRPSRHIRLPEATIPPADHARIGQGAGVENPRRDLDRVGEYRPAARTAGIPSRSPVRAAGISPSSPIRSAGIASTVIAKFAGFGRMLGALVGLRGTGGEGEEGEAGSVIGVRISWLY